MLTADLAGVHADGEKECEVQLLEHLGKERARSAEKLRALVTRHRSDLKKRSQKAAARIARALEKNEQEPALQAAAHALQLSSELDTPKRFNRGNLHPYRLKVKQLRYILQMAPDGDSKFVEELGKVKEAIGEWHDWEELGAIANAVLGHGPNCKLIRTLKKIGHSKYQEAVGMTEQMRKHYLATPSRKKPSGRAELKAQAMNAATELSRKAA